MDTLKSLVALFVLAALLGGCAGAETPEMESTAGGATGAWQSGGKDELVQTTPCIDYKYFGSFEAAVEAGDVAVRAMAGGTSGMMEIACGIDGSTTTEYTITDFTVQETLKGELRPGQGFELYQLGTSLGPFYGGERPLAFVEGDEYILCLFVDANGRYQLLTPYEGAYTAGECGAEGEYQPYTQREGALAVEPYYMGEGELGILEWEIEALPPLEIGPIEIVDIQGPFPLVEDEDGNLTLLVPEEGDSVP